MTELENPICPIDVVICLHLESVRPNSKLLEEDSKGMHPMLERVLGSDDESILDLHAMLCVEGLFWTQPIGRVGPCSLNVSSVNILLNNFIQLLLIGKEVAWSIQRVLKRREMVNLDSWSLQKLCHTGIPTFGSACLHTGDVLRGAIC